MKKTILEIYASLVCFVTVVCCSIWLGAGAYSLIGVVAPEITLDSWGYQRHQSNEEFSLHQAIKAGPMVVGANPFEEGQRVEQVELLSDQEITEQRLASYKLALQSEVRKNKQSLLKSVIVVVICLPLFLFHWRLVRPNKT